MRTLSLPLVAASIALLAPAQAVAQSNDRGICFAGQRNPDAAIAACTRMAQRPGASGRERAEALHGRGVAWVFKGSEQQAISDYTAANRADPRYAPVLYERGKSHARLRDQHSAIRDYTAAIAVDPKLQTRLLRARARAYHRLGQYDNAIADFNVVAAQDPRFGAGPVRARHRLSHEGRHVRGDHQLRRHPPAQP